MGAALISVPSAALFRRCGRRSGFLVGCVLAVASAGLGAAAVLLQEVALVFAACFAAGLAQGLGQFYRFAAMEVCTPSRKPFAVTLVLSGGVIAAFAGPELANETADAFGDGRKYLASFVAVGAMGVLNAVFCSLVRYPPAANAASELMLAVEEGVGDAPPPSLLSLMAQPRCMLAVAMATAAHTSMVMLMSPVTLAMEAAGFPSLHAGFNQVTFTLEMHFFSMVRSTRATRTGRPPARRRRRSHGPPRAPAVCAGLRHRPPDRAAGPRAHRARRHRHLRRVGGRAVGARRAVRRGGRVRVDGAVGGGDGAVRRRVEPVLLFRDGDAVDVLPAGGRRARAGRQRLCDLRDRGRGVVRVGLPVPGGGGAVADGVALPRVVGRRAMATLVALLLLFSILGRPRPHGGGGSPTDSTTTGGLGLLNSRSETGDADLLPRTGSVLSALSAVSAAASDVTRASVASEAMFVPPKETDDERPRTPPRRGWLDW